MSAGQQARIEPAMLDDPPQLTGRLTAPFTREPESRSDERLPLVPWPGA